MAFRIQQYDALPQMIQRLARRVTLPLQSLDATVQLKCPLQVRHEQEQKLPFLFPKRLAPHGPEDAKSRKICTLAVAAQYGSHRVQHIEGTQIIVAVLASGVDFIGT